MTPTPARSFLSRWLVLAFLLVALPALGAPVGFVTQMQGIVQVQPENATTWQPAAVDGSVSVGDSIRTEAHSTVKILLVDDTVISVAEDSELYIDRMIVGDLATQERSILREMRGQVRAQVGKAFGGTTRLEIHTPTAIVGVRGSTMNVKVKKRRGARGWVTIAAIQNGNGFACSRSSERDCVDLEAGQASTIPEVGPPSSPAPIPSGFDAGFDGPAGGTQQASAGPSGGTAPAGGAGPDVNIDSQLGFGPAGVGAGGGSLAGGTETALLDQQALDPTNAIGQSVGPAEAFEEGPVAGGGANNPSQMNGLQDPSIYRAQGTIGPPIFGQDSIVETPGENAESLFGGDTMP